MFYRLKSELLSEHLDLVVAQLAITEIGSGVPPNGCGVPISHVSSHSEPDNFQRPAPQRIDGGLSRNAIVFSTVFFNFAPAANQKTLAILLGISYLQIFDFEQMPVGNYLAETRIGGVGGLKRRRPNRGKVSSGIVQISRLTLAKPAVGIFVGVMHYQHHRNTGNHMH